MTVGEAMAAALAHYEAGRPREAEALYRKVLAAKSDLFEAWQNLGAALYQLGRLPEAVAAWERAALLRPGDATIHHNLGAAFRAMGRQEPAIAAYQRALALDPNDATTFNNLATALREQDRMDEMVAACRRAIALRPDLVEPHNTLGNGLIELGLPEEAIASYDRALALDPTAATAHSNKIYALHNRPEISAEEIYRAHLEWGRRHGSCAITSHANDRSADRPLRVGYVSPDFRQHSIAFFLLPLLEAHDRARFEITCYTTSPREDSTTPRFRAAGRWQSLIGLNDAEAAQKIHDDRIDILVDLSGHTAQHRLQVFAHKPAPVQVTWLGYPNTTGLTAIDWRLTDARADPPGAEALHSERLMRLPRTAWCFTPLSGSPPTAAPARDSITFGSFNAFTKINPPLLKMWSRILEQVPDSRLLLKNRAMTSESARVRLLDNLAAMGIAPGRVDLMIRNSESIDHLLAYQQIDIALDTYPYHGTTTTCEALWMGVPVITLAGRTHVSRVGVSLLENAGLPDLVAASEPEFVRLAVELARNAERRRHLRAHLREQMRASPLMDAPKFARDVETAYREMWRQWISPSPK
jgi:protein O-GlcNAc transferase